MVTTWSKRLLREYVLSALPLLGKLAALPGVAGTLGDGDGVSQVADKLEEMRSGLEISGQLSPARSAALSVPGLVLLRARALDHVHGSETRRWSMSALNYE